MFRQEDIRRLEELVDVDADVEPVDRRRRDLGVPDGLWFSVALLLAWALMVAGVMALGPRLGQVEGRAVGLGLGSSVSVFAAERWGHRRYRFGRALRDAARILLFTLAMLAALLLGAYLRRHR